LPAHGVRLPLGVLEQLLTRAQRLVEAGGADRADDHDAQHAADYQADQYPSGDEHACTSGWVPVRGIPNLAEPNRGAARAPRELLLVYVARCGRSVDVVLSGFARSIRKRSCAGNSSNSESSSYRPSPLECKAPPREPRGALVCEAGNAVGLRLDRCQSVLRRQPATLEIGADVRVAVAAFGQSVGTER